MTCQGFKKVDEVHQEVLRGLKDGGMPKGDNPPEGWLDKGERLDLIKCCFRPATVYVININRFFVPVKPQNKVS